MIISKNKYAEIPTSLQKKKNITRLTWTLFHSSNNIIYFQTLVASNGNQPPSKTNSEPHSQNKEQHDQKGPFVHAILKQNPRKLDKS